MKYSNRTETIFKEAEALAYAQNSNEVCIPHVVAAALKDPAVYAALNKPGKDVGHLDTNVTQEANACTKITKSIEDKYARIGVRRTVRKSIDLQNVILAACNHAEDGNIWNTGYVEISHVFMAIVGSGMCKSLNEYFDIEDGESDRLNNFLNDLIAEEAKERGIEPNNNIYRISPKNKENKRAAKDIPFCTDLLAKAENDVKPFIGRTDEIVSLMECLERMDKPNAILSGPPGVGKTDIVRGLAKRIVEGDVPPQLADVNLYSVDIPGMLAGSEYRGSFEKKLKQTIEAACEQERPILFIDEIHTVLGAGKTMDSAMDAANILKPYLTEGKIRVVGATTDEEYRKHVEKDSAFMRRFQKIDVSEPNANDSIAIIDGVKPAYEAFHNVHINKDAVKAAVNLSVRHMHDRFLPDKAIDIIDQTCARVKTQQGKKVTVADVEETVSKLCHIPAQTIKKDEMSKVRTLDADLKKQVFGQDEAIDILAEAIQLSKSGLGDENKPIGSFLFVGPSGVGKTEVAKQLAKNLGIDFVRFDMSEYAEPHAIAKLIGAPAGYVGYDDGGILVEQIRKHPNSVVLFDEIEKAHRDIYKIFLQILDYGMLSDNKGRKADFRNTVIIMTSNAGNQASEKNKLGFGRNEAVDRKATSMTAVKEMMAPELRGRMSATVVFNHLSNDVAKLVVRKELKLLDAKLKAKGISVKYTEAAIEEIVKRGVSAQYGAREIQRVVDNEIKKMFVKKIVSGKYEKYYTVDSVDNNFTLIVDDVEDVKAEVVI